MFQRHWTLESELDEATLRAHRAIDIIVTANLVGSPVSGDEPGRSSDFAAREAGAVVEAIRGAATNLLVESSPFYPGKYRDRIVAAIVGGDIDELDRLHEICRVEGYIVGDTWVKREE